MPQSSYTGAETISGRHKDAKFNLKYLVELLKNQSTLTHSTATMFNEQIERICDSPFELFNEVENKEVFYEKSDGRKIKKYKLKVEVTELI